MNFGNKKVRGTFLSRALKFESEEGPGGPFYPELENAKARKVWGSETVREVTVSAGHLEI